MTKNQKSKTVTGVVLGATGMFIFPTFTSAALIGWGGWELYKHYKK